MKIILLLLAVLPPLFIAYYIYIKDIHEREPIKLIFLSLFLGAISVIPVLFLEGIAEVTINKINLFFQVLIGVALIEEGVKYFFLMKFLYKKPDFNEPFDGIVYTVMLSLGFALVENIVYVFVYYNEQGISTAIIRMFTAIPMHTVFGVVMGYFVGLSKFNNHRKFLLKTLGLVLAIALHFMYDFFIFLSENDKYSSISILSFITLIIGIYFANKAIIAHQKKSPFKVEKITFISEENQKSIDIDELSLEKEANKVYVILGFVFAFMGGYLGMCIGINYAWGKYNKKTKQLGWAIMVISLLSMTVFNTL